MSGTPKKAGSDPDQTQSDESSTVQVAADPSGMTGSMGEQALVDLKALADENWDKYVRALAELDNVRKRAQRDVDNARKFALDRFASDLLGVRDSLELGLASGDQSDDASIREGCEATLKLLTAIMEQFGITEIDPQGEPFDPQLHEAIAMRPSDDLEPGSIVTVFQKGYTLNGRLLRPARVVVSTEPTASP